jgi:hypothetical protein
MKAYLLILCLLTSAAWADVSDVYNDNTRYFVQSVLNDACSYGLPYDDCTMGVQRFLSAVSGVSS